MIFGESRNTYVFLNKFWILKKIIPGFAPIFKTKMVLCHKYLQTSATDQAVEPWQYATTSHGLTRASQMCLCRTEKRFVSNSRCLARGQDLFTLMFVLLQKNDVFLS